MKRKLQENPNTMYQDSFLTTQTTSEWSRKDNKAFEEGLVMFAEELPDRWQRIANQVGKSMREVMEHYEALVHDVCEIDSGRVEVPSYVDEWGRDKGTSQISFGSGKCNNNCGGDGERKKGTPWTEEEHKKFLIGLSKFGKGDWRSISRNVVVTRTPTQVASHAQKYFIRQNSAVKKERKRSSIHDITTVDNNAALPVDESPILLLEEPVQPPTIQALPHSRYFPILDGLIPSNNVHNQEQGRLFGYPNFSFPM